MPERDETRPAWPPWYGLAALGLALVVTLFASLVLLSILKAAGVHVESGSAGFNIAATLIQDAALALCAVYLAQKVAPVRLSQFGVRKTRLRPAIKWIFIAVGIYLLFQLIYVAAVHPSEKQTTLEDLGAGNGGAATVLIGVLVVGVAPPIEEFFFRGFLFGAARSSWSFVPAALFAGLIFGGVHATTGVQAVPPLMALGFSLCLLYEATGSILPGICVHALNNMLAFGVDKDGSWAVGAVVATLVVTLCVTLPGRLRTLT